MPLDGKRVLLTGGTGSFGRHFTRVALERFALDRLVIFSRDEAKQYEMAQTFAPARHPNLRYFIGDVRDAARLEMAMRDIDIVVHAAALKHVTVAEYNPFECIKTNVHGAENVVNAAIAQGVKRVLALSTDKAVSPVNLYGASKLAADKICVAANALGGRDGARFACVRYGNVVGSRGSVVPFFAKLVAGDAKALPITDPRMTRFWITLQQGVDFVIDSIAQMDGGEIFVPKIPSMRVTDLAAAMGPGLQQDVIGIRPGEKLHEALIGEDDARSTFDLGDYYILDPAEPSWSRRSASERGGAPVPEDFRFTSDVNADWLNGDALRAMVDAALKDGIV